MAYMDSVDKVVQSYFAAVNSEPFTYKGVTHEVRKLTVSPLLLRGYTCPAMCGGCCNHTFTLDYLPSEVRPYKMASRSVTFNGKPVKVFTDYQQDATGKACRNLIQENGRCGVHGHQPFSCDFELIRFLHSHSKSESRVLTRLFGRGFNMMRVDGDRGALCTITQATEESRQDTIRKLQRLAEWCEHFGLPHRVDSIIQWAKGPCDSPLVLPAPSNYSIL